ncbi:hypothetical protein NEOLEDRAFT_1140250 [Neolentinus lepideus HHB14362 ss-1]|uniref:FHA domain-containing protein n=1 Tax=Neolentinus lepideus HHB14362 ss-1 TaxID=1314782 RepID=A0A165PDV7_9AGAM|nr:hypothetical protein NEOLEDRAFT_1140250 [Neolentinus lepideus HHB14362 ss-1]
MPAPAPPFSPQWPALYLYPLNDSFSPKHISLANGQRVKIGRQTNAKTVPAERNGYFDSKVLSRQHAEVWEEGSKIFIKDVKSSNGTFINSERLSGEGLESEPFELKTDDIVEFGIDIVGEDNKTIIHHKVAARVWCVMGEADMQNAQRAEQQQQQQSAPGFVSIANAPSGSGGPFNFGSGAPNQPAQRRPTLQQQGISGMGGLGGSMRPPGKGGLTFDTILSRLQGELQKSRDTGNELHSLSDAMNNIQDTLGGAVAPTLPPHPQSLPPVRPSSEGSTMNEQQSPAQTLRELQAQLHETQNSIAGHVDKMRTLEGMLAEHDAIKREINSLRELLENRKHHPRDHQREDVHDDDDAASVRSVDTIRAHELERVEEEDEDQLQQEEDDEERRRRREELGRPRTPEPTGIHEDEDEIRHDRPSLSPSRRNQPVIPDNLTQRLTTLSNQLESALELSRSLQAQHVAAQTTISSLESKVSALEVMIQSTQDEVQAQRQAQEEARVAAEASRVPTEDHARERESLKELLNEWKKSVEGQWSGVQEEWHQERERLRKAREEFESRTKAVEEKVGSAVSRVDGGLAKLHFQVSQNLPTNGDALVNSGGGLVTPPSPRSLSSDSIRSRQRRKRASSSRGRTSSRSHSRSRNGTTGSTSSDSLAEGENIAIPCAHSSPKSRPRSPWISDDSSDSEAAADKGKGQAVSQYPPTPESSTLLQRPSPSSAKVPATQQTPQSKSQSDMHLAQVSTAVGVLMLSVAAAAVIWRVKPE